jgi:predicted dehydrogenase
MPETCVLIGLGKIGMGYDFDISDESAIFTHARAIAAHPAFQLAGAVDISPKHRASFEMRYGVPAFDQVEVALRKLQPGIVVVATPSETHGSILAQVVNSWRPKLLLCEKPLAYKLDEAHYITEMCEKAGIELFVNYNRRSDPGVIEIKRRIDRGEISTPAKVNAWYSKGIMNNGSHIINLLEFWLGDVNNVTTIRPGRLLNNYDSEPDVEFQFDLGTVVFRAAWEECYTYCCLELLSPSGRLRYDKGGESIEWQSICTDPIFDSYKILAEPAEAITNGMRNYQWHVYDQICKFLEATPTTLCTGRQALRTLEAIHLAIR